MDLQLRPAPMSKVSGLVIGPDGPAANMALHLVPAESELGPMEPAAATTLTDCNGAFTLLVSPRRLPASHDEGAASDLRQYWHHDHHSNRHRRHDDVDAGRRRTPRTAADARRPDLG